MWGSRDRGGIWSPPVKQLRLTPEHPRVQLVEVDPADTPVDKENVHADVAGAALGEGVGPGVVAEALRAAAVTVPEHEVRAVERGEPAPPLHRPDRLGRLFSLRARAARVWPDPPAVVA